MFFLVLTLIARAALVCIVAISGIAEFGYFETKFHPSARWIALTDGLLEGLLTLVIGSAMALELALFKSKSVSRSGPGADFVVLVLLSAFLSHSSLHGI